MRAPMPEPFGAAERLAYTRAQGVLSISLKPQLKSLVHYELVIHQAEALAAHWRATLAKGN